MTGMRWMAIVLVALVGCSALAGAADDNVKRIAVVNVSRVFNAYQKVKDVQDKMDKLYGQQTKALRNDEQELQRWKNKLEVDPREKTNPELFKEVQQFEWARFQFGTKANELQKQIEESRKNEMKAVLNDIRAAIRAIGTGERYDLVLRAPEFEEEFDPNRPQAEQPQSQSAAELVRKFRENPVMYFSQGVDITDKVIAKLNNDYKEAAK